MAKVDLAQRINEGLFLLDGAMGTELMARGVEAGKCSDYLNIESPGTVLEIHRAYLEAGSDGIITNTFGANRFALGRHGFGEMAEKINTAAARLARRTASEERYVLGDIGPSGDFLEPLGALKADELKAAFAEQARGLLAGGVDGFIIETMMALEEIDLAVGAVKSVCDLPVLVSLAYDSGGAGFKTMMGVDVAGAVEKIAGLGVVAIGFNCGTADMDGYVKLAGEYVSALSGRDVLALAEPNAGLPKLVDGRAVYNLSSEDFVAAAEKIYSAGVTIIGGCCGTGPAHIEAVAKRLKQ